MMRAALLGSLLCLCGCGTWRIEFVAVPAPDTVRWQGEITGTLNDHTRRLATLEASHATPTPTIGGTP